MRCAVALAAGAAAVAALGLVFGAWLRPDGLMALLALAALCG